MLRQFIIPSANNHLFVLPEVYYGKKVMVTVSVLNEKIDNKKEYLTKTKEARNFFNSLQVDMSEFKFNREEANER